MSGDALLLPLQLRRQIRAEMERAYPAEGCGVLLGRAENGLREVQRAVGSENRWSERRDRYRVDPDLLRRLLEEEDGDGPQVLGFYHSHPDAAPVPSETDRAAAWPWYHYLIVPTASGSAGPPRVWELDPVSGRFVERPLRSDGAPGDGSRHVAGAGG